MDLLSRTYGASDDDDEEAGDGTAADGAVEGRCRKDEGESFRLPVPFPTYLPPPKRRRPEFHPHLHPYSRPQETAPRHHHPVPRFLAEAASSEMHPTASAGRYVSKRERAMLAASSAAASFSSSPSALPPHASSAVTDPVVGFLSDSDLSIDILSSSKCGINLLGVNSQLPSVSLNGHTRAVNSIQWSQSHSHLLASAGMDQTVHIWNVWSISQTRDCIFKHHNAAVKDVRWSPDGFCFLSCGYDCSSRLVDIEKKMEKQVFKEDQIVEVIRFHPINFSLFLSGGSKGSLRLWDIRTGQVEKEYVRGLDPILDIEFSPDGKSFISSSDNSKSRISEDSIIVWNVSRQVPLSKQVYAESYTCTCVRYHPYEACFVAQTNGNYTAIFSARPPYKLNKYKRYQSHGVWGFPIKCNFSLDGKQLASGSSDGCVYLYDYRTAEVLRRIKAFEQPCVDVAFHPQVPNVMASCSWAGEISVF